MISQSSIGSNTSSDAGSVINAYPRRRARAVTQGENETEIDVIEDLYPNAPQDS